MAQASLLISTQQFLIKNIKLGTPTNPITLDENTCNISVDGTIPPISGEFFIAIHPNSVKQDSYEVLDSLHSINVTVVLRADGTPFDRFGQELIAKKYLGIEEIGQKIIEAIHMNYQILLNADVLIDDPSNKWIEPLRFISSAQPRLVGSEWFHGAQGREAGIVYTLLFGNARRVQFGAFQPVVNQFPPIKSQF